MTPLERRFRKRYGDAVMMIDHFGNRSGPFEIVRFTPTGAVRIRYNERATELFRPNPLGGEYMNAYRDDVHGWRTLVRRVQ